VQGGHDGQCCVLGMRCNFPSSGALFRSAIIPFMKEEKEKQGSAKDLVCEMEVDPEEATAEGLVSQYKGKTYYFCCSMCKESFDEDPAEYVK
jgi:YHS domain-containing protein